MLCQTIFPGLGEHRGLTTFRRKSLYKSFISGLGGFRARFQGLGKHWGLMISIRKFRKESFISRIGGVRARFEGLRQLHWSAFVYKEIPLRFIYFKAWWLQGQIPQFSTHQQTVFWTINSRQVFFINVAYLSEKWEIAFSATGFLSTCVLLLLH